MAGRSTNSLSCPPTPVFYKNRDSGRGLSTSVINRADLMKELLDLVPDMSLNTTDMFGNTPLHYAAAHESTKIINLLLPKLMRYKMNVDERNKLGFTPLLIAASNGRLGSARRLYETDCVSTEIADSLYFKTTHDWLSIYFEWDQSDNILLPTTKFTNTLNDHIQIEKHHLMPIQTKPPVNSMLENFSRQQTAVNNRAKRRQTYTARSTIIPEIVLTRPFMSTTRPYTAPESIPILYQRGQTRPALDVSSPRIMCSHKQKTTDQDFMPYLQRPHAKFKKPGCWQNTIEIVNLTSDQLSQSYRPPAVPEGPTKHNYSADENARPTILINADGSKTKDILLGVLGKVRKQVAGTTNTTTSNTEEPSLVLEEGTNKTGTLKAKMLKYAATRRAFTSQET